MKPHLPDIFSRFCIDMSLESTILSLFGAIQRKREQYISLIVAFSISCGCILEIFLSLKRVGEEKMETDIEFESM